MKNKENPYITPAILVIDIISESVLAASPQLENYEREAEHDW